MDNEEQCCAEAPYQPNAVIRTAYPGGGGGNLSAVPKEPGLMKLTEEALLSQEQLRQTISELEKILSPICLMEPMSDEANMKEPSQALDRPDVRIRIINTETNKAIRRLRNLLGKINI